MKVEQRHIWKDCEELADDARYTPQYADLYRRRKETIERVFADVKEKHTMRYTLLFLSSICQDSIGVFGTAVDDLYCIRALDGRF